MEVCYIHLSMLPRLIALSYIFSGKAVVLGLMVLTFPLRGQKYLQECGVVITTIRIKTENKWQILPHSTTVAWGANAIGRKGIVPQERHPDIWYFPAIQVVGEVESVFQFSYHFRYFIIGDFVTPWNLDNGVLIGLSDSFSLSDSSVRVHQSGPPRFSHSGRLSHR